VGELTPQSVICHLSSVISCYSGRRPGEKKELKEGVQEFKEFENAAIATPLIKATF
jgi:hypothetical protein